jgi:hypothetical protein
MEMNVDDFVAYVSRTNKALRDCLLRFSAEELLFVKATVFDTADFLLVGPPRFNANLKMNFLLRFARSEVVDEFFLSVLKNFSLANWETVLQQLERMARRSSLGKRTSETDLRKGGSPKLARSVRSEPAVYKLRSGFASQLVSIARLRRILESKERTGRYDHLIGGLFIDLNDLEVLLQRDQLQPVINSVLSATAEGRKIAWEKWCKCFLTNLTPLSKQISDKSFTLLQRLLIDPEETYLLMREPAISSLNVVVLTWNVGELAPNSLNQAVFYDLVPSDAEVVVIGLQEVDKLSNPKMMFKETSNSASWEALFGKRLPSFVKMSRCKLGGVQQMIFVSSRLAVRAVVDKPVEVMRGGKIPKHNKALLKNKGAIITRLHVLDKSICFVTAHLNAGLSNAMEREKDFSAILTRVGSDVRDDVVIFSGDLNSHSHCKLAKEEMLDRLQRRELGFQTYILNSDEIAMAGSSYQKNFAEAPVNFMPTYRVLKNGQGYDPQRAPAFTDRVLFRTSPRAEMAVQEYISIRSVHGSDHIPVRFRFTVKAADVWSLDWDSEVQPVFTEMSAVLLPMAQFHLRLRQLLLDALPFFLAEEYKLTERSRAQKQQESVDEGELQRALEIERFDVEPKWDEEQPLDGPGALYWQAMRLLRGIDGVRDELGAVALLQEAGEHGPSLYQLAVLRSAVGDDPAATALFQRATRHGSSDAWYALVLGSE